MLRDKNLVPLSHQHQHALALCVRIQRGLPGNQDRAALFQHEISAFAAAEMFDHFEIEELFIFPPAREIAELAPLVSQLQQEHTLLRSQAQRATTHLLSEAEIVQFSAALSGHIRREERELFERMQRQLSSEQLRTIGQQIEQRLSAAPGATCRLRNS